MKFHLMIAGIVAFVIASTSGTILYSRQSVHEHSSHTLPVNEGASVSFFYFPANSDCFRAILLCPDFYGQDVNHHDTLRVELRPAEQHGVEYAEARGFLWRHWSEKKQGDLFLTSWSREGERTDSHYEIEVNQQGVPLLVVHLFRHTKSSTQANKTENMASESLYRSHMIERVSPRTPYDIATAKIIHNAATLPPSKYRLRFKDEDGHIITDF